MSPHPGRWRLAVPALVLVVTATACAATHDPDAEVRGGGGGELAGSITISGSSTVEPITSLVAETFREEHRGVEITVDGPGTGDGFELFCQGEVDITGASRRIKEPEVRACAEAGIDHLELRVGIDGMAVLTNPANDAVTCLSFTDLYALVGPESEGVRTWSEATALAREVERTEGAPASQASFPDAPLEVFGPGEESGTYDSFVEIALEALAEARGQEAQTRADYNANADDNVIVQGIAGSRTAFGWVGFAFYEQNRDALKALDVADDEGRCTPPTAETIASGGYPLSRPLFVYVNAGEVAERDAVAAFVDHYLSDAGYAAVAEVGYVQLEPEEWDETRSVWAGR